MSRTMAEKYALRFRRFQRAERIANSIVVVFCVFAIPSNLYAGQPLHAIACLLFLWESCRDLATPQWQFATLDTLPAEGTPTQ